MKKITFMIIAVFVFSFAHAQYLTEDFETSVPPAGWLDEAGSTNGTNTDIWEQTTVQANGGANSAYFNDSGAGDRWLITSVMDLSGASNPQLTYYDHVNFVSFADTHDVMVSTDYSGSGDPEVATWTPINTVIGTEDTWVLNGPYSLPISNTVYVAFHYIGDNAADWYIDDILVEEGPTCSPAVATATNTDDCGNSQFSVTVTITDFGDATSLAISNDAGVGATTGITNTGLPLDVVVGPFTEGTSVNITLEHEQDSDCNVDLGAYSDTCPPSTDATLTINAANCGVTQTTTIAYDPGVADVNWIELVYDGNCDEVTVDTETSVLADTEIGLFDSSGVLLGNDDDGGTGTLSLFAAGVLPAGTYYIAVGGFNVTYADGFSATSTETEVGDIVVNAVASEVLSIEEEELSSFSYYPNPVKNTLTLNAQNNIETIRMYNMLGQEVMNVQPQTVDSELDMSRLETGTYFVQVTIANVTKTVRIVKQ